MAGTGSFLSDLINVIGGLQGNQRIDGNIRAVAGFVVGVARELNQEIAGAWWALERIREEEEGDAGAANNAGVRFGAGMAELRIAIRHLVDTVIPNSVYHAHGEIYSNGISPLRQQDRVQNGLIGDLEDATVALQKWRTNRVDPFLGDLTRLAGWIGGIENFPTLPGNNAKNWLSLLAEMVHQWDAFPAFLFERGGDPRGSGLSRVVGWLNDGAHQGAFDDLLQMLIDGSPDRYRHIINATETILASPYP